MRAAEPIALATAPSTDATTQPKPKRRRARRVVLRPEQVSEYLTALHRLSEAYTPSNLTEEYSVRLAALRAEARALRLDMIRYAIKRTGSVRGAARVLGCSPRSLWRAGVADRAVAAALASAKTRAEPQSRD